MKTGDDFRAVCELRNLTATRLACILVALLMPAGITLDYFTYPHMVREFLALRVTASVFVGGVLALSYLPAARQHSYWLAFATGVGTAITMQAMIERLEGYGSPYYAGLNLLILGAAFIFTWTGMQTAAVCGSILAIWMLPALASPDPLNVGPFFNNLYFLVLTSIIAVAANSARHALAKREFEATARLNSSDKRKIDFFTNMSHELRTPLTLILAPLEELVCRSTDGTPDEALLLARRNAVRLLGLVNNTLDLARLDAGGMRLRLEKANPIPFLGAIIDEFRHHPRARVVRLELHRPPEELPAVVLDREIVHRVLVNLLANALKFTNGTAEDPGLVVVTAEATGPSLRISVSDNGVGIPEDELERVFDRFHRVIERGRHAPGTGLGLALVKSLVELHHGTISVESVHGRGTTFAVTLPRFIDAYPASARERRQCEIPVRTDRRVVTDTEGESGERPDACGLGGDVVLDEVDLGDPQGSVAPARRSASEGDRDATGDDGKKRPTLLVVDDNADVRSYLSEAFADDYCVLTAPDGETAFRIAVQERPDMIVTDVMMPRRTGTELIGDLRGEERTRHIPVIMLTALAGVDAEVHGLEAGADDYIVKPFHPRVLRTRIRSLLDLRKTQCDLAQSNDRLAKANLDLLLAERDTFFQTIEAFAYALEAKDPYTHGHARRVSILAWRTAQELGWGEAECERVRIAAVLHDIGKIGVPEGVLGKPGRLSAEEVALMQRHAVVGASIVDHVVALQDVAAWIRHHHERLDGKGYPGSLAGEAIPPQAKLMAVCDTYDAMTSDRPYRAGQPHAVAIAELGRCSGTQFDPNVVSAFMSAFRDEAPQFPSHPSPVTTRVAATLLRSLGH